VTEVEFNVAISNGNQVASHMNERKEMNFPFIAEECKQILSMLKLKYPLPIMLVTVQLMMSSQVKLFHSFLIATEALGFWIVGAQII